MEPRCWFCDGTGPNTTLSTGHFAHRKCAEEKGWLPRTGMNTTKSRDVEIRQLVFCLQAIFAEGTDLDLTFPIACETGRQAAAALETLDKRCRLLTTALEGEAVKVSELDGEWRCDMCGAQGEGDDTPISHQSDCILVGGIRTDGGEGGGT